jgi:uncharacterized protein (TIGR02679 family)
MIRTVDEDLAHPGLARLLGRARDRFEALGGTRGGITLEALTRDEAEAIDAVWRRAARRRPRRGQEFPCSLRDLDASLVETFGLTLEEVLVRTGGPLRLKPLERTRRNERTAAFWERALGHPLSAREPNVRAWLERLRRTGAVGAEPFASPRGRSLMLSLEVGETLPRLPPIERSTLANEVLGDPHALDDGNAVGERLVAQLAARAGVAGDRLIAAERRDLLQRFGVLSDPASATVLTLGLRPIGDSPLEQAVRLLAGTHVVITLGQLRRWRPRFDNGHLVRLCENPTVVLRAEDRLGSAAPPLVCTGGWPGSAVCALLDALRDAGARFDHHGDYDWEGLAISRWLMEHYVASPWRFDATAYRGALTQLRGSPLPLKQARHRQPTSDPLVVELSRSGVAVPEEAVLDDLIADLSVTDES